jgi:hypothetical protein
VETELEVRATRVQKTGSMATPGLREAIDPALERTYFFFSVLGFELRAYSLSHSTSTLCDGFFKQGRVSGTICLGWLRTSILLISASSVAGITGVSHGALQEHTSVVSGTWIVALCHGSPRTLMD